MVWAPSPGPQDHFEVAGGGRRRRTSRRRSCRRCRRSWMSARPLLISSSSALPFWTTMPYCPGVKEVSVTVLNRSRRCCHIVDDHAVVGDDRVDAARLQLLPAPAGRPKRLIAVLSFADQLGHHPRRRWCRSARRPSASSGPRTSRPWSLPDRDQPLRVEVGRREVHRLLALVGDGDRRHQRSRSPWATVLNMPSQGVLTNLTWMPAFCATAETTSMSKRRSRLFVLRLERRVAASVPTT